MTVPEPQIYVRYVAVVLTSWSGRCLCWPGQHFRSFKRSGCRGASHWMGPPPRHALEEAGGLSLNLPPSTQVVSHSSRYLFPSHLRPMVYRPERLAPIWSGNMARRARQRSGPPADTQ